MSNKQINKIARLITNLDENAQLKIRTSSDDALPTLLQELGITLPTNNWLLVVLKIVLYSLGLILAGIGTVSCSTLF